VLVAAGAVLSIVAAWVAVRGVDLERTVEIVRRAELGWLVVAIGVIALQVTLRSFRWQLLLPVASHGVRPTVARIVPVTLVGYLGNTVLPARLGEPLRAAVLARREGLPTAETLGSVVLERMLDTLALAAIGVTVALGIGAPGWVLQAGGIGLAASLAALVVVGAIAHRLDPGHVATSFGPLDRIVVLVRGVIGGAAVTRRPTTIARVAAISLVAWALDAALFWLAGRSIGLDIGLFGAALVSVVTVLSTAIPSAPGYVGTFDLAAATAAGALGVDPASALALALVAHAITVLPVALAGALSAAWIGNVGVGPVVAQASPAEAR
jgi:uncharacterized membrane protein YbhN (UPF0104 family)